MSSYRADREFDQNRDNRRRSQKHERKVAKLAGGRVTKGSGSGFYEKGDVRVTGVARIECKVTKHASFSVTEAIIDKIENEAVAAGEAPALSVELGSGRRVYVIPEWALNHLIGRILGEQEG